MCKLGGGGGGGVWGWMGVDGGWVGVEAGTHNVYGNPKWTKIPNFCFHKFLLPYNSNKDWQLQTSNFKINSK